MKSILRGTLAAVATAVCSSAMAAPMTAVIRLNERVPVETLAYYAKSQTTPMVKYYSADDIKKISAPTEQDYQNLMFKLAAKGFNIVNQSPTHLWVTIKADSSTFENVFSTRVEMLENGKHKGNSYTIPADLSLIASVVGLDNTRESHPHYKRMPQLSNMISGISPDAIKSYYGFKPIYAAGVSGAGQHVAVATYNGFNIQDVNYFYKYLKLSPGPTVDQVQFNGTPKYDEGSAGETELDAEFIGMIAPGANVHVFASAENSDAGELAMFTAILDDNRAKVVNYSWGGCEGQVEKAHQDEMTKVFARAVAQGVNILAASGDSGSDSCQNNTIAADWPAGHPAIVAVGGTSLTSAGESAWSGSGGGISGFFALPAWQTQLGGQFVRRSYPDVAFNADPYTGQAVYIGRWEVIGGTSMAAPQWAGFLALTNEARVRNGKGTLGFLNPIIYSMSAQDRAAAFNDITEGNNGGFNAVTGWDAVTGLGSMHADVLIQKLMY